MGMSQATKQVKQVDSDMPLSEQLSKQLYEGLKKRGLLREEEGKVFVDLTKINKPYLPRELWGEKKLEYQVFFQEVYMNYRETSSDTPERFLRNAYEKKLTYNSTYIRVGANIGVPVNVETLGVENPEVTANVSRRKDEQGQPVYKLEVGATHETNEKKVKPYVRAEKSGMFARITSGAQKLSAGIYESIFSITAYLGDKTKYLFSTTLGPWIGKLNLATGRFSGSFFWVLPAFEMVQKAIARAIEGQDKPLFKDKKLTTLEGVVKGAELHGTDARGNEFTLRVDEVKKKSEKKGEVVFVSEGKRYVARLEKENNASILAIYEKEGFWAKMKKALNPKQLGKDLVDVLFVSPWKKLQDLAYMFRSPTARKLDEKGKQDAAKKLEDAIDRQNYNTARYFALLLIQNSKGSEKARYMLTLDRIEWGMAHTGLGVGYIRGMGFGSKRIMVRKSIGARIKENLEALKKKDVSPKDYECALLYIVSKAVFIKDKVGKMMPVEPLPEELTDAVLMGAKEALKRSPPATEKAEEEKINFRSIKLAVSNKSESITSKMKEAELKAAVKEVKNAVYSLTPSVDGIQEAIANAKKKLEALEAAYKKEGKGDIADKAALLMKKMEFFEKEVKPGVMIWGMRTSFESFLGEKILGEKILTADKDQKVAEQFSRFMSFLQNLYERVPKFKEKAEAYYANLQPRYDPDDEIKKRILQGFALKVKELPENSDKLSQAELEEIAKATGLISPTPRWEKINFRSIKLTDDKDQMAEQFSRFMSFLQNLYERVPKFKEKAEAYYAILQAPYDPGDTKKKKVLQSFALKVKELKVKELPENSDKLSQAELEEIAKATGLID